MTVNALPPDDDRDQLRQKLRSVLPELTPEEQAVLVFRFGLQGGGDHTLAETTLQFDVTRERVRQIEAKALRKSSFPGK